MTTTLILADPANHGNDWMGWVLGICLILLVLHVAGKK
jgi:hypothetical protein